MAYPATDSTRQPCGVGVFQFSLTALFIVMTVVALVLSAFFGIGRVLGMSTMQVATQGMARLVFSLPTLMVWTFGLAAAIQRRRQNPLPAKLSIVALSGLMAMLLASQLTQMALINGLQAGWLDSSSMSWYFVALNIVPSILNTVCWILILVAIFVGRPADPESLSAQTDSHDPFADAIAEDEGCIRPVTSLCFETGILRRSACPRLTNGRQRRPIRVWDRLGYEF